MSYYFCFVLWCVKLLIPWARFPPSIRVIQGMVAVLHNELHLCDELDQNELSKYRILVSDVWLQLKMNDTYPSTRTVSWITLSGASSPITRYFSHGIVPKRKPRIWKQQRRVQEIINIIHLFTIYRNASWCQLSEIFYWSNNIHSIFHNLLIQPTVKHRSLSLDMFGLCWISWGISYFCR